MTAALLCLVGGNPQPIVVQVVEVAGIYITYTKPGIFRAEKKESYFTVSDGFLFENRLQLPRFLKSHPVQVLGDSAALEALLEEAKAAMAMFGASASATGSHVR